MATKFFVLCLAVGVVSANPSAQQVLVDVYHGCLKDFSVSCVKPKALSWISQVANDDVIQITEDLSIVKDPQVPAEVIVKLNKLLIKLTVVNIT